MGKPNSGKKKGALQRTRRAQVSAEVIIVTAAVLAVAFILVMQLQKTANDGSKAISNNAKSVFKEINDTLGIAKGVSGASASSSKTAESAGVG